MTRIPELRRNLLALAALMLANAAAALPEDDAQTITFEEFASTDYSLDEGLVIQRAHPDRPTCIRQGTRLICGAEIRFERADDGTLRKVTATGTPASFEQKPAADQEVAHFTGRTLVFDNEARLLTIDGDAKFWQGENELIHCHIEYDLDTRDVSADCGDSDASGRMLIGPTAGEGN